MALDWGSSGLEHECLCSDLRHISKLLQHSRIENESYPGDAFSLCPTTTGGCDQSNRHCEWPESISGSKRRRHNCGMGTWIYELYVRDFQCGRDCLRRKPLCGAEK